MRSLARPGDAVVSADVSAARHAVTSGDHVSFPTFSRPPVTEVVVGVSFRSLDRLSIPLIGELWLEELKEHFPKIEEHPPYEPPVEQFDSPMPGPSLSWQFGPFPALPRLWFLSSVGDELIQLQRNWFSCNWRKVLPEAEYGRWQPRRDAFEHWFSIFSAFLVKHEVGTVAPIQAEVTYVNHVRPSEIWQRHGQLPRFLRLAGVAKQEFLPEPEQIQLASQYLISNEDVPVGRLHVTAQPGLQADTNERIYVLTLTARGRPEGEGADGLLRFLDRGREWIVKGFVDMTTPDAHKDWGLRG